MFSATKPLPLTVPTVIGESATSFASRLARRNGVSRMITFCSDVGIDYFGLVTGEVQEIQRLATLGGVDTIALQNATPTLIEPGWFRLGRERIKFTAFVRTRFRICPICIQEAQDRMGVIHHGVWQLGSIRTCALHGCHLIPVPKPKNGNDCFDHVPMLDSFKSTGVDLAVPQDQDLERYLIDRIQNGPGQTWLDSLPFHIAAQTCEMLGALLTLGPKVKRAELTDAQWGAAGSAGLSILRGGAEALCQKLKEIQDSHPVGEKLYRSHYGVFFDWLRFRDDDRDFDVVRDVVREFIFGNFPVTVGSIVLGKPCPEQMVHSFSTAKQVFGISHHRVGQKLVSLGMAKPHASDKFYVLKRYIPTVLLIDIIAELGTRISAKEAAKVVGVEGVVLAGLERHGLIPKQFEYGKRSKIYRPEDLEAFLEQLRGLAKPAGANSDLIDIPTAACRRGVAIAALTELILKHRIPLYFEENYAENFRAFRVHPSSLHGSEAAMLADMRQRLNRAGLSVRIGLGDTRGAAWARAHYGEGADLADLPVAALRLDPITVTGLERMGLRRIGQLRGTPRAPVARRFGSELLLRLDQALGDQPEQINPEAEPPHYAVRLTLPEPIGLEADVMAGVKRLLDRLCDKLNDHQMGARVLCLNLRRVPVRFQAMVFHRTRIVPNWSNCLAFIQSESFENGALIAFFGDDETRPAVLEAPISESKEAFPLRQFMIDAEHLADIAYSDYIRALPREFKKFPDTLSASKRRILIDAQRVTFNAENLAAHDGEIGLQTAFVAQNIASYLHDPARAVGSEIEASGYPLIHSIASCALTGSGDLVT